MNFDNGHRQRQGQHNKRGRGRNNRRSGGGGGGQHGGGNSINRVYESNGPDVKVRGTAQTIAEKYMQLGRDAHSSGDNVAAESYYQFAEHYFRVLQAAQPPGQLAPQILRRPGEEAEEELEIAAPEGEEGGHPAEGAGEGAELAAGGEEGEGPVAAEGQPMPQGERQDHRPREHDGREGRERFRPRWQQRRFDRNQDGQRDFNAPQQERPAHDSAEASEEPRGTSEAGEGNWEAPSFLKRPVPAAVVAASEEPAESAPEPRQPRPRRGRPPAAEDTASED